MNTNNISYILSEIEKVTTACGRSVNEVELIAVSKTFGVQEIKFAIEAGLVNFGENKAQELNLKASELAEEKILWHFIGHLQSNKVKYVVPVAEYIHSVDSLKIAIEIEKAAAKLGKKQKVLLEIKTAPEENKYGLTDINEIFGLIKYITNSISLDFQGLMTIAPFVDDETEIRKSFVILKKLKEEIQSSGYICKHLSMGMTSDFQIAIEEGATMLRIGSAIFGNRNYN
jgi:pyridoxal phosphate enzyme (YggS family)